MLQNRGFLIQTRDSDERSTHFDPTLQTPTAEIHSPGQATNAVPHTVIVRLGGPADPESKQPTPSLGTGM